MDMWKFIGNKESESQWIENYSEETSTVEGVLKTELIGFLPKAG